MRKKENAQPQELVRLRQRLDGVRRGGRQGKALPEWTWTEAGRLARRHGVYLTCRALGLGYNKLKRVSGVGASAERPGQARTGRPRKATSPMQFVDLSGALATGGDCRLVLEGPGGQRLSVQMSAGAATAVVLGLCRAGFGARS